MAMEKINHTKKQGVSPGISVGGGSGKTNHRETGEEGKGARVQTAWHKIVDVRIRIWKGTVAVSQKDEIWPD